MSGAGNSTEGGYLPEPSSPEARETIERLRQELGSVPNFFRVQAAHPSLIESQLAFIRGILGRQGGLTRQEKEYIFIVCAAANLSTYCVISHCEFLRLFGVEGPEPEQVALDYTATDLPLPFKALLNFASKLNRTPHKIAERDIAALRTFGFSSEQILEAVLTTGLARFTNTVSLGLGLVPDYENPSLSKALTARAAADA